MAFSGSGAAELGSWDAVETAARIRARDVSPIEVIDAAIARVEAATSLGAVTATCFERAREDARRPIGGGGLAGVPTFVKDLAHLGGVRVGMGSRAMGEFVSKKSDPFVSRFADTGVIYLGKSAAPEFGLTATTEPIGQAPCRNPWDRARSAGGSSGGAAALVSAGVVPIAHASDGGGSIRIPASVCGLVGLKPSRLRMDMEGSSLLPVNLATDGVVSTTVRDTVAFLEAFESAHPPRKIRPIGTVRGAGARRLRMAVFTDSPLGRPVNADAKAAALDAAKKCEALGHRVDVIGAPFDAEDLEDFLRYWGFLAFLQTRTARIMLHRGFDGSKLEPLTNHMSRYFTSQPRAVLQSILRLRRFPAKYARALAGYDVLVSPSVAAAPPKLGFLATDLAFDTMFDRLKTYVPFTPLLNAAGAPAISLPLGRSEEGLPLGVQFAAAHGDERTLLELAFELEAAHPWPRVAPPKAD